MNRGKMTIEEKKVNYDDLEVRSVAHKGVQDPRPGHLHPFGSGTWGYCQP